MPYIISRTRYTIPRKRFAPRGETNAVHAGAAFLLWKTHTLYRPKKGRYSALKKTERKRPLPLSPTALVRDGAETEDGVPLLLWRAEFPAFDAANGKTEAAAFYEKAARKCEEYLTGRFADLLREEYRAADPARRRFSFRPALYAHTVRIASDGAILSVERTVTLKRAGRVLFTRDFCERWDETDGSPIAMPDGGGKTRRPRRKTREKKREKG